MAFFKDFLTKQLLKKQLKGVPEDQQEKIMTLIQKDPEFFKVIGEKIQEEIKNGKGQMEATMSVMKEHREKLGTLLGESGFTK
jgi:Na+-translocating ferredoxin:NAD+ oxidoreductase RnfG subunit